MPVIRRFRIEGLAGRSDVCSAELNPYVNVCYGQNGSGKTSLLRILHSALANDADILKHVPFSKAEVVIYSYAEAEELTYKLDNTLEGIKDRLESSLAKTDRRYMLASIVSREAVQKPRWECDTAETVNWSHKYLPISRLYASTASKIGSDRYRSASEREEALEARFSERINDLWSEYTAQVARDINRVQEDGLAKILESVISPAESESEESAEDPNSLYAAVSKFLSRRGMQRVSITGPQFLQKFKKDSHFRSVARHIETIETGIADHNAPAESFRNLINELFQGRKSLILNDKNIEVKAKDVKIALFALSSGEKQILRMLVDLLAVGAGIILIDEPELSMHVDWQRRLIPSMRALNSNAQMIFATHSPEIMAALPDEEIFRI
jgi:predicted ATP-dependent endonuclease of OLD family